MVSSLSSSLPSRGTIVTGQWDLSRTYWLTVPGTTAMPVPGGEHDELGVCLAGRLDDHASGKSRRYAQFRLHGLVVELLVDGGAEFRLGSGPLLPFGMHRRTREAADRADRRLVRAHRDERCLPPAGLLCSQPQRLLGGLGVIHSYDNGHTHSLLWGVLAAVSTSVRGGAICSRDLPSALMPISASTTPPIIMMPPPTRYPMARLARLPPLPISTP
jgi:hypothetical protein